MTKSSTSRRRTRKSGSLPGSDSSDRRLALGKSVRCDDEFIYLTLTDGRVVTAPLTPRLRAATPAQRAKGRVRGWGTDIRWEEIDEDVGVAYVLGVPEDELDEFAGFKKYS